MVLLKSGLKADGNTLLHSFKARLRGNDTDVRDRPILSNCRELVSIMNWTTEYPTKPGFYWIRNYEIVDCTGRYGSELTLAEVEYDELSEFEFYLIGSEFLYRKANLVKGEWQGPIEPESEKPISPPRYDLFPETICVDCMERSNKFISWPTGEVDGKFTFALICYECWIKRLTPEQRKVYMV